MATEERFIAQCDAPKCSRILETSEGNLVFESRADLNEQASDAGWARIPNHAGHERIYCGRHWHWRLGVRMPFWGMKTRDL